MRIYEFQKVVECCGLGGSQLGRFAPAEATAYPFFLENHNRLDLLCTGRSQRWRGCLALLTFLEFLAFSSAPKALQTLVSLLLKSTAFVLALGTLGIGPTRTSTQKIQVCVCIRC